MAELADAPDSGSGGQPCRFNSCYSHQKEKTDNIGLFFLICMSKTELNGQVSATEKSSVICNGRRQKVDTYLLLPRRDSKRFAVRQMQKHKFLQKYISIFSVAEQLLLLAPRRSKAFWSCSFVLQKSKDFSACSSFSHKSFVSQNLCGSPIF